MAVTLICIPGAAGNRAKVAPRPRAGKMIRFSGADHAM